MKYTGFDDTAEVVQTLNLSFLGQPVDPTALDFLTTYADLGSSAAIDALSEVYYASDAFQDSYANGSSEDYVRAVHFNLFDRNTEKQEIDYWTGKLDAGAFSAAALPLKVLGRAQDSDIEAYSAKLYIADYFTEQEVVGGYVPDALTFPALRSNDELWGDLQRLDAEYDTLSLEVAGTSLGDNPLYAATVGTGEKSVLFITQQHGDEPIGTESAMYLLEFLSEDSELAQSIRDAVTVTVVPRVNPDGFDRWEREVGGERGLIDPRLNNAEIDLNRTHDPAAPFSIDEAPESVAVNALVDALDPDFLFDYHGQGNYRSEDGKLDTMSVLWPVNAAVDADVVDASKRAAVAIDEALQAYDYDQLTLYPGSDNPAIARNGFALGGTPTVLVEQRFGQEMFELSRGLDLDYSALLSALALEGFVSMKGIVSAVADGSIETYDPARAEQIPERSDPIQFAELYSDDIFV